MHLDPALAEQKRLESAFVGQNYAFYERRWKDHEKQAFFPSWNWAAFFFAAEWMVFRKMYMLAIITFAAVYVITPFAAGSAIYIVSLLIRAAIALSANALYANHVRDKIQRIQQQDSNTVTLDSRLEAAGGTSILSVVILDGALLLLLLFAL